jgi:hypothetical protein
VELESGNTRSHCEGNWFWKRLWTSRKTDYEMNESKIISVEQKLIYPIQLQTFLVGLNLPEQLPEFILKGKYSKQVFVCMDFTVG